MFLTHRQAQQTMVRPNILYFILGWTSELEYKWNYVPFNVIPSAYILVLPCIFCEFMVQPISREQWLVYRKEWCKCYTIQQAYGMQYIFFNQKHTVGQSQSSSFVFPLQEEVCWLGSNVMFSFHCPAQFRKQKHSISILIHFWWVSTAVSNKTISIIVYVIQ